MKLKFCLKSIPRVPILAGQIVYCVYIGFLTEAGREDTRLYYARTVSPLYDNIKQKKDETWRIYEVKQL